MSTERKYPWMAVPWGIACAVTVMLAAGGFIDPAWFGLATWFGFLALRTPA